MSLLWINGVLVDKNEARVSPFDHGFLYGDGVWIPLRVFNGKLFHAEEQLQHLFASASRINLEIPLSLSELTSAVEATLKANERTTGYIRVIVSRGPGTLGPDPRKITPQVIIIAEEYQPYPLELYAHGLHAVVYPAAIDAETALLSARVLGQPHIALAKRFALRNGCLEAILTNQGGTVLGTTEGSLVAIRNGSTNVSQATSDAIASFAITILRENGVTVNEVPYSVEELLVADELFQIGTSCGVIGIIQVNGKAIGEGCEGSRTRLVREAFQDLIT